MKKLTLTVAFLASLLVAGAASADETASAHKSYRGIVDLPPTEITSPPMRPLATIDVSRIEPNLTLLVLRHPFLGRIEEALFTDRF